MAAKYLPLGSLLVVATFSLLWGSLTTLTMLWRILRVGPKRFFTVKRRERPGVVDNPDLGRHGYVSLTHDADVKPLKLHYVSNGDEGKPLMLFLHGFPEFWYSWRHQLREFGKDYRAVAVDMRGYGESDAPRGIRQYTIDKLTADVKEVITALGYERAVIVSHDWGGGVAWAFAHQYPEFVDKLIICNIGHNRAFAKRLRSSFSQAMKSWYMMFFQLPFLPEIMIRAEDFRTFDMMVSDGVKPGTFTQEDVEAFKYTFSLPGRVTGPINYYRAALRFSPPRPVHSKISAPTLLVWGTGDKYLEKEMAVTSGDYCEDFTLHWVEGASHWVQQEEPEVVNKHMRDFLLEKK